MVGNTTGDQKHTHRRQHGRRSEAHLAASQRTVLLPEGVEVKASPVGALAATQHHHLPKGRGTRGGTERDRVTERGGGNGLVRSTEPTRPSIPATHLGVLEVVEESNLASAARHVPHHRALARQTQRIAGADAHPLAARKTDGLVRKTRAVREHESELPCGSTRNPTPTPSAK